MKDRSAELRLDMPRGRKVPGGHVRYQPIPRTALSSVPAWWFHPGRPETRSRTPDPIFQRKLDQDFPGIHVNWHPLKQRWQVWTRSNRVQTPYCRGWLLLFTLEDEQGDYVPLDERTLVVIWDRSARRWGNGKQYFNRIESEIAHEKRLRAAAHDDERDYKAGEYWDYTKIKNIGSGSKFTRHHAGD